MTKLKFDEKDFTNDTAFAEVFDLTLSHQYVKKVYLEITFEKEETIKTIRGKVDFNSTIKT